MDVVEQRKGDAKGSERPPQRVLTKQVQSNLDALPPTVNATTTSTTERDVNFATQFHLRKYDNDGALRSARYNQLSNNHD